MRIGINEVASLPLIIIGVTAGWYLWIISLPSGAVIRSQDTTKSSNYDRYTDYHYLPNVEMAAKELRMFHEFIYLKLFEKDNAILWLTTVFGISNEGVTIGTVSARRTNQGSGADYPSEVKRTLGL
ncbi:MAG TPA: hypothetical protein VGI60_02450 [Chthoniobacterales bacterium]|jgi:hypothetical protein